MCKEFIKEVYQLFQPKKLPGIVDRSAGRAVWFFTKVLFFSLVVMILLFLPQLVRLPSLVGQEMGKFESISFSGTAKTSEPIRMPSKEPLVTIDTQSTELKMKTERLLVTKDAVYTRILTPKKISIDELKNPSEHKGTVSGFVALAIIFSIPSALFYSYIMLWLIYFILILLASTLIFLLIDLTHYRKTWKQLFKLGCYGSIGMVVVEVLLIPFKPFWLFPIFNFIGVSIYASGIALLLILTGAFTLMYHYSTAKK